MVDPYAIVRRLTGHELISPKDARLLTEAVDGLINEIGSKDARIAELEAEVVRLTKERDDALMVKREAVAGWRDAKPLSRTGAVRVSDSGEPLANELRRLVSEYHEPDTDGTQVEAWNLIADFAIENADAIVVLLLAAGFRILGPDEVDPATVEKCAVMAETATVRVAYGILGSERDEPVIHRDRIATAIRTLGRKA